MPKTYQQLWRERNKEKLAKYQHEYRLKNKTKLATKRKEYDQKNIKKQKMYRKIYREQNKKHIAEYQKKYKQSMKGKLCHFKSRCGERKIKNDLSQIFIESYFQSPCIYCGNTDSLCGIDRLYSKNQNGNKGVKTVSAPFPENTTSTSCDSILKAAFCPIVQG